MQGFTFTLTTLMRQARPHRGLSDYSSVLPILRRLCPGHSVWPQLCPRGPPVLVGDADGSAERRAAGGQAATVWRCGGGDAPLCVILRRSNTENDQYLYEFDP